MRLCFITIFFSVSLSLYGDIQGDFIAALDNKRYIQIRELLNQGASIDKKDEMGYSPLISMVIKGNADMIQLLLQYKANINSIDPLGYTALHHAVEKKYLNIAEMLLLKGAESNSISNENETPVFLALKNNDLKMTELLIQNGGEIDFIPNIDPIMEDYLNMRVSLRNKLYGLDFLDRTELMEAVFEEDYPLVAYLLSLGADVNEQNEAGLTALMMSSGLGNIYITRILIEGGASGEISDRDNQNALSYAMLMDNLSILEELLNLSADINPNSLFYALFEGKKESFSRLLESVESVDVLDNNGRSLLMYASYLGDYFAVRRIVEKKGKINTRDMSDKMALTYCLLGMKEISEDYYQIATLLVKNGAITRGLRHNDPEMTKALKGFRL